MPTIYTVFRAQHRHAPTPSDYARKKAPHRRHYSLKAQHKSFRASLSPEDLRLYPKTPNKKVLIIGAGLAGLCAAYELQGLGYEVEIYEARARVGGRVHSFTNFLRKVAVEGGAELIGLNHPLWCQYKTLFKLRFLDTKEYGNSPVRMGGQTLTFETGQKITDEMDKHIEKLNRLAESILDPHEPWTNPNAKQLDNKSLAHWLDSLRCSSDESVMAKLAIEEQLTTDNGLPASKQSLLAVLAMIKGHGINRYWTDTELYRCEDGNEQLAKEFCKAVGKRFVHLKTKVASIDRRDGKIILNLERSYRKDGKLKKKKRVLKSTATDVVLAVPPSVWKLINFDDKKLRALLRKAPHIGSNVKNILRLKRRFWEDFSSSPTLSDSSGPADMTWETTEAEDRPHGVALVAFSGANYAKKMANLSSNSLRDRAYLRQLEAVYPGIRKQITATKFVNWPKERFTRGSYYFPRTKEVVKWGPFWKNGYGNWLHFAGEHTSYAFMGYMEGALSSGYRLAQRLAVRDKLLP
jgi:monoamine oxidase